MIDLKVRLEHIKTKCTELQLVPQPSDSLGDQSDSGENHLSLFSLLQHSLAEHSWVTQYMQLHIDKNIPEG